MKRNSTLDLIVRIAVLVAVIIVAVGVVGKVVTDVNEQLGNLESSSTNGNAECVHLYDDGICNLCGTVCKHTSNSLSVNGNTYCDECRAVTALKAPVLSVSGRTVSWTPIEDAEEYVIYINGESYMTKLASPYFFDRVFEGEHAVAVQAVNGSVVSAKSDSYSFIYYTVRTDANDHGTLVNLGESDLILHGEVYRGKIVPDDGYLLPDEIYVTMGGKLIGRDDGLVYNYLTGEFSVTSVTGNLFVTYDAPKIGAPSLTLNGSVLSWNAIEGAIDYHIRVMCDANGFDQYIETEETSFDLSSVATADGEYYVAVWADFGDNGFGEASSIVYNTSGDNGDDDEPTEPEVYYDVLFNTYDHGTIEVPEGSYANRVTHGENYEALIVPDTGYGLPSEIYITMGGAEIASSGYTYNSKTGYFIVYNVTGELYITYDAPSMVPIAPELTLSGNLLSWDAVANAKEYRIHILCVAVGFDQYFEVTETSFDLATAGITAAGDYYVSVTADGDYGEGDASSVTYHYTGGMTSLKLETPVIDLI